MSDKTLYARTKSGEIGRIVRVEPNATVLIEFLSITVCGQIIPGYVNNYNIDDVCLMTSDWAGVAIALKRLHVAVFSTFPFSLVARVTKWLARIIDRRHKEPKS